MSVVQLERHVKELCHLPAEISCAEFKKSNSSPQLIGELAAALPNASALGGKNVARLVWGIKDGSHEIIGTGIVPSTVRIGNQDLENWLV